MARNHKLEIAKVKKITLGSSDLELIKKKENY